MSCPALPGCHTQGDSAGEALRNIKEAIAGCMQSLSEERIKTGIQGLLMEVTV